jgi:hypothetical protein
MSMSTEQILKFIEDHPRCTAKEAGTTTAILNTLEIEGLVVNVGFRATGHPGRPSVEWALPGVVAQEDMTGRISCGIPGAPTLPDLSGVLPTLAEDDASVLRHVQRVFENPGPREKADMLLLYNTVQRIVKKRGLVMEAADEMEELVAA